MVISEIDVDADKCVELISTKHMKNPDAEICIFLVAFGEIAEVDECDEWITKNVKEEESSIRIQSSNCNVDPPQQQPPPATPAPPPQQDQQPKCDTSGSVPGSQIEVPEGCSLLEPVLCCDGLTCISEWMVQNGRVTPNTNGYGTLDTGTDDFLAAMLDVNSDGIVDDAEKAAGAEYYADAAGNGNDSDSDSANDKELDCGDGSDETTVPFSQCAAERETSPIVMKRIVAVQCQSDCVSGGDHCQQVVSTDVPTFVNKDVADM